jgi:uncharacterized damage-inducible protein DinB
VPSEAELAVRPAAGRSVRWGPSPREAGERTRSTPTMGATVKHLKQFEKIFLGIRENADEKLAQLNSEFVDHQEWLRKAVVDTKESK